MVDVAALTSAGSAAGMSATPAGGYAAAAQAAGDIAKSLSDSGNASSTSGDIKFGDMSISSGFGTGAGLSTKKMLMLGGFLLGGMLIYGLFIKK